MTATSSSQDTVPVLDRDEATFSLPSIPTLASVLGDTTAPAPVPAPAPTFQPRLAPAVEPAQTLPPPDAESVASPDTTGSTSTVGSEPGSFKRWLSGFTAAD